MSFDAPRISAPEISVLMTTYREEEPVLREAVDSVLAQTFRNFELLIVRDDPENETHTHILLDYAERDPRIRLCLHTVRTGQTAGLNEGIAAAQGTYIARMDADDIAVPARLAEQLDYLTKHNADLIGGLLCVIRENGEPLYSVRRVPVDPVRIAKCLRLGDCVAHPSWFGRKSVFTALGGYRPLRAGADYDFLLRAALSGYTLSNLNRPAAYYRIRQTSVSRQNLYRQYRTMKYLSKAYSRCESPSLSELENHLQESESSRRSASYARSDRIFYEALGALEKKRYGKIFLSCLSLLFGSPAYLDKIRRLVLLNRSAVRDGEA